MIGKVSIKLIGHDRNLMFRTNVWSFIQHGAISTRLANKQTSHNFRLGYENNWQCCFLYILWEPDPFLISVFLWFIIDGANEYSLWLTVATVTLPMLGSPLCVLIDGTYQTQRPLIKGGQPGRGAVLFFFRDPKLLAGTFVRSEYQKLKYVHSRLPFFLLLTAFPFFRGRHSESLFSILPYFWCLPLWHQLSACPPLLHP